MPPQPLQYQSLKTVLQYMEPNLRFHLSQQLPSIRQTEKCVDLRVKNLEFGQDSITVNGTKYELQVCRCNNRLTKDIDLLSHDLDDEGYGVNLDGHVAAGDIRWADSPSREISQFELRGSFDDRTTTLSGLYRALLTHEKLDLATTTEVERKASEERLQTARRTHKRSENASRRLACRQNRRAKPYTLTLQLTVSSPHRKVRKVIYHREYDMKIHEAMRLLNSVIFDGRTLHVNQLKLTMSPLRFLSEDRFKIETRKLEVAELAGVQLEALQSMLRVVD